MPKAPHSSPSKDDIRRLISTVESIGDPIRGGQKTVFEVAVGGKKYALKVVELTPEPGSQSLEESLNEPVRTAVARTAREITILKDCKIPQIVKLGPIPLQVGFLDGREFLYYAEEWIEGQSVRAMINKPSRIPISEVVSLGLDMVVAIDTLWNADKIHRDIKPENIMRRLDGSGYVLLDLGLALDLRDVSLTVSGQVVGTPPYLSPEQTDPARKRALDFRSDLFSLGVVLYETSTGKHPFWERGIGFPELVRRICTTAPARPSALRADLPAELEEALGKLLAKKQHLRFKSCELAKRALEGVPF